MPFFVRIHRYQTTPQLAISIAPISTALLMVGILTGCQTTSHLPSSSTPSSSRGDTPSDVIQHDTSQSTTQQLGIYEQGATTIAKPTRPEPSVKSEPSVKPKPTTTPQKTEPVPSIPPMPVPETKTAQQILLEQARQNSKQASPTTSSIEDGSNIPAFQRLMNTGMAQMRQGQLSAAQSTFTRAQRIAPQSSAVYYYLSQIALKQNQPLKAEAMARRGLVVAQTTATKKALWQIILMSGQAQGNTRVINEAKAALAR
ncbi:tetratricopeptide repeat protein [Psychrobacter lutiphocae]|uniref:tetratricopeptide repeat protein n=1 Tax=Psychrobacter lutiphocae TaxID=540500 RepID=UPI001427ED04|nr:tetratricopeptide repeat protein [Psychrobacter lutiphocae]